MKLVKPKIAPKWALGLIFPLLGASWLVEAIFGAPSLASGMQYRVFADDLTDVSALAFDVDSHLFATLEGRHGQGEVVHIKNGAVSTYLSNLDKPDGILMRDGILYVTSEAGENGLLVHENGVTRFLTAVNHAEGIDSAGAKKLLVIEDINEGGRLLRVDPTNGNIEVLLSQLDEGEGVCQTPGGDIYFVEKTSEFLQQYSNGQAINITGGLSNPGFLNCLPDGSILITEDKTNFGRLLHYRHGVMHVVASRLRAPQSVIVGPNNSYYLAEQRRDRILFIDAN